MKQRKRYTTEFKAQAVELLATGKLVPELVQELRISSNLLYNWRSEAQGPQLGSAGVPAPSGNSGADELRALRRENARLQIENDILKKAAVILGTKIQVSCGK
jgi:transposase